MEGKDREVSIIVPVYNAEKYIRETVSMVLSQTFTEWELILVDDCSGDKSAAIIEEMISAYESKNQTEKGKIRLIRQPVNQGAAMARNRGIDEARGRYIAFLDADDIWLPKKLARELAFLKEKQAAFVFTAYEFGDEQANRTGKIVHVPERLTYKKALSRTVIFTTTVLLDTKRTGRELIHMPVVKSEDTATWWKLLRNGFTAYGLDEVLAVYRRPAKSLSSNKWEAIKRIWHLYRKEEKLSLPYSLYNFIFWAFRATLRRI